MNSLRKSSKSLKRFINTKAKDHGIHVQRGTGNTTSGKETPAPTTTTRAGGTTGTSAGKPSVANPAVEKAPVESSVAPVVVKKHANNKTTATTKTTTPRGQVKKTTVGTTKKVNGTATTITKASDPDVNSTAKGQQQAPKKATEQQAPKKATASNNKSSSTTGTPQDAASVNTNGSSVVTKRGAAKQSTTASSASSIKGNAAEEPSINLVKKRIVRKPSASTASIASTKSAVEDDTASIQKKERIPMKSAAASVASNKSTDGESSSIVQQQANVVAADTCVSSVSVKQRGLKQPSSVRSHASTNTAEEGESGAVKQRAAVASRTDEASLKQSSVRSSNDVSSAKERTVEATSKQQQTSTASSSTSEASSAEQQEPEAEHNEVSSIKQRAAKLGHTLSGGGSSTDGSNGQSGTAATIRTTDTSNDDDNNNKKATSSSISVTSATASVQSNTSRGSALVKATATKMAAQRSAVSRTNSNSGLPPRATKSFKPPPVRHSVVDHNCCDETSTIATTFTTPISYVEFSADDTSKQQQQVHIPNDDYLEDATTRLLVVDLHSPQATTVQAAMEQLVTFDVNIFVQKQHSALSILISMRRWLTNANIQIAGLQILMNTASDHLDFCQAAVQWGALQVCLAAMQNHPRNASVQKYACGALVQLVVADAHTFVLKLNGVQIVTQTAVPHAPKFVVFLLQYLSYWQDDFRTKLVRDGGLQALAEIVEGSSGNLHKAAKATMQRLL